MSTFRIKIEVLTFECDDNSVNWTCYHELDLISNKSPIWYEAGFMKGTHIEFGDSNERENVKEKFTRKE